MDVYLRYEDRTDGPFDSLATAARWAFDNGGHEPFTAVSWAELTADEIDRNDLHAPEIIPTAYVRYPDGRVVGPFEDFKAADDWALDQGGEAAEAYELLDEDEYAAVAGTQEQVIQVKIKVSGLASTGGWSEEPFEAVTRVLDRANGEAWLPYTFEVIG